MTKYEEIKARKATIERRQRALATISNCEILGVAGYADIHGEVRLIDATPLGSEWRDFMLDVVAEAHGKLSDELVKSNEKLAAVETLLAGE